MNGSVRRLRFRREGPRTYTGRPTRRRLWVAGDTSGSTRPTVRALVGTLIGAAPGFLLPLAIIAHVHIGRLTDAYAFSLGSAIAVSSVLVLVLQANLLPILQRVKQDGRQPFVRRLRRAGVEAALATTVLYGAWGAISAFYVAGQGGWTAQGKALVTVTLGVFGLFVFASSLNSVLAAGLNAFGRFLTPAATQAFRAVLPLAVVAGTSRNADGLVVVAACVGIGELGRTMVLGVQLHGAVRTLPGEHSASVPPGDLTLWRAAVPHGLASLMAAVSPMIDRAVAATLAAGSVTLIDLGEKILQVPLTAISTSLILVAGTRWAKIGTQDVSELARQFRATLVHSFLLSGACVVAVSTVLVVTALVAGPTVAGVRADKLTPLAVILMCGLPAACVINAATRLLTSTRKTHLLPALGICMLVTNLVFDVVGAHWLGAPGIALSSTIYRYLNAGIYVLIVRRLFSAGFPDRPRRLWTTRAPTVHEASESVLAEPMVETGISGPKATSHR